MPDPAASRRAEQGLQEQPGVSIRRQLSLGLLLWFLLTLGLAIVSMVMISRIIAKLAFLEAATNYTFEIQQAQHFEKNYFLYGTNLADALEHVHNARGILEAEGRNIVAVTGQPAFDVMAANLGHYEESHFPAAGRGPRAAAACRRRP